MVARSGIRFVQGADGANYEGLALLLWADGNPIRDGTAQNLGHGIGIFSEVHRTLVRYLIDQRRGGFDVRQLVGLQILAAQGLCQG